MPKAIMLVQSSPVSPQREDEYNTWYDEQHIPDALAIPGIVGARRYRARDTAHLTVDPSVPSYVAVYDLDADDLDATLRAFREASVAGRIRNSSSVRIDPPPVVTVYELHSEH